MEFRATRLSWLAGLVALAVAVPLFAQTPSLAEIAKKEQERRAGLKGPAKVYTNDDLKKTGGLPSSTPAAAAGQGDQKSADPNATSKAVDEKKPAAGGDAAKVPDAGKSEKKDTDQKDEPYWRARMTQAREELRRNEMFLDALQSRVNALSAEFTARDDPSQRAQIADDRQKALAELDRVKAEITKGQQTISDIEEEARKAGVPAGWLR
jgi:hypothetical protein